MMPAWCQGVELATAPFFYLAERTRVCESLAQFLVHSLLLAVSATELQVAPLVLAEVAVS